MKPEQLLSIARDIVSFIENAVLDVDPEYICMDSKMAAVRDNLISSGFKGMYLRSAMADILWSDVDTLRDLVGDRIYDTATLLKDMGAKNSNLKYDLCLAVKEIAHSELKQAVNQIISSHGWDKEI